MKLLDADPSEHTVTISLDKGPVHVFGNVPEDVVSALLVELYGKDYAPGSTENHGTEKPKSEKAAPVDTVDFI